ncbi:holo-[acyl-carrier-protein] synthase [Powellomyces hirtus]|uniref:Holo-[acyl-carrier-protein] synthase n=1 Tax=Powellomyces hirtus TaxID=109895 RepID=A0A507DWM3_9FUNG|nr:holo-[acyl-carrier-protein] synthase [Powellomyces hirtus]
MPILGLGIDIIHLPRLHALLTRHPPAKFTHRILSTCERLALLSEFPTLSLNTPLPKHSCGFAGLDAGERRLVAYLGARWAVKEAAFKAMYPVYTLRWPDVAVVKTKGKPYLILDPAIAKATNVCSSHVSMSHDGEYAYAQVIFETPP